MKVISQKTDYDQERHWNGQLVKVISQKTDYDRERHWNGQLVKVISQKTDYDQLRHVIQLEMAMVTDQSGGVPAKEYDMQLMINLCNYNKLLPHPQKL